MLITRFEKFLLFIFTLALINLSCDENPPIPEQKFLQIYVDLLVFQDTTTSSLNTDSLKKVIFNNHGITADQYDSMIEYYNAKPEKWIPFFDSVTVYVDRLRIAAENQP